MYIFVAETFASTRDNRSQLGTLESLTPDLDFADNVGIHAGDKLCCFQGDKPEINSKHVFQKFLELIQNPKEINPTELSSEKWSQAGPSKNSNMFRFEKFFNRYKYLPKAILKISCEKLITFTPHKILHLSNVTRHFLLQARLYTNIYWNTMKARISTN